MVSAKTKKWLLIFFKLLYFSAFILHFFALILFGFSWVISTILFYTFPIWLLIFIINKIQAKKQYNTSNNQKFRAIKYYTIFFLSFLLVMDLIIRFSSPWLKSYSENNYGLFYRPYYSEEIYRFRNSNLINKFYTPSSERIFNSAEFSYKHSYNELGIRERNNILELSSDKRIILTIGDSFTEGVGTHQDSTWQVFLEHKLNKTTDNFIVVNAGISASDPVYSLKNLNYFDSIFNPEFVILSIGNNDFNDIVQRGGFENFKKRCKYWRSKKMGTYIYAWNFIYRLVLSKIYQEPELFITKEKYNSSIKISEDIINQTIDSLINQSKNKNFTPIIIFNPTYNEVLAKQYTLKSMSQTIDKYKNDSNLICIDILENYQQSFMDLKKYYSSYYWLKDGHNTHLGYEKWSEIIYKKLKERKVL